MTGRPPGGVQPSAPIREVEWPLVWNNQPPNVPVFWRMRGDFYRNQVRLSERITQTRVCSFTCWPDTDLKTYFCHVRRQISACRPSYRLHQAVSVVKRWKERTKLLCSLLLYSLLLYGLALESDRSTSARRSYKSSRWSIFWPGLKPNKMNITYRYVALLNEAPPPPPSTPMEAKLKFGRLRDTPTHHSSLLRSVCALQIRW